MVQASQASSNGQGFSDSQLFDVVAYNSLGERCMVISANQPLHGAIACARGFNSGSGRLVAVILPVAIAQQSGADSNALDASQAEQASGATEPARNAADAKSRDEACGFSVVFASSEVRWLSLRTNVRHCQSGPCGRWVRLRKRSCPRSISYSLLAPLQLIISTQN